MNHYYIRKNCRLCESQNLVNVLPLKPTALCDAYLKDIKEQDIYPLDLYQCQECGFVQIGCVIEPEVIYRDYIYVTTSSSGLKNHFKDYANCVIQNISLPSNSLVLDIGSNDGTLLSFFKQNKNRVLGIEPSINTAKEANQNGIETLPEFFNLNLSEEIKKKHGRPDLITINNLFANIDDLNNFTKGLQNLIADNGVLVIESSYLIDMVDNMVFDFIYHEHLSYFSILPLVNFFSKFDMHLIHVEHVPTKGGSIRYYWAKKNSSHEIHSSVPIFIQNEKALKIDTEYFAKWNKKIQNIKQKLIQELSKSNSSTVIGYGASATSTTLIYHFELENKFSYLIDDNPGKIGTYSPGNHIQVKSIEEIDLNKHDSVIVILAWRYYKEILSKLEKFSGKIIIPLPDFQVISNEK